MNNYIFKINDIINNKLYLIARNPNILGMGLGNKIINGRMTQIPSLTFLVKNKVSLHALSSENRIPSKFLGIYTDVIDANVNPYLLTPKANYPNVRPAPGGVSIGTVKNRAGGTLGYPVIDKSKNLFILSGPGVMSNDLVGSKDITVYQPASYNTYTDLIDKIATFTKALPLKVLNDVLDTSSKLNNSIAGEIALVGTLSSYLLQKFVTPQLANSTKTVVTKVKSSSKILKGDQVSIISPNYSSINGIIVTTPFTLRTRITDKEVFNKQLSFINTVQVQFPSHINLTPRDIGALVVDTKDPSLAVGLLIAGLSSAGVFYPLDKVLSALGVNLLIQ